MATTLIFPATVHHHRKSPILTSTSTNFLSIHFSASCNCSTSKTTSLHRSFLLPPRNSDSRRHRYRATSPHPPESGPPPDDEQESNSGAIVSFSRFQESVQIFFAVLFWMSLFFWSSVWDGRNNGRSDKGPKFWK